MTHHEAQKQLKGIKALLASGLITYDQYIARKRPIKKILLKDEEKEKA